MKNFIFSLTIAATLAATFNAHAADATFELGPDENEVNVMKDARPTMPTFAKLDLKAGWLRGWVKDAAGQPVTGAKIGVRATATGGFYSGASATSDARGYYEIKVPWGAAHYYCAGASVKYGEGSASLSLHPADGDIEAFPSGTGHTENWVLWTYGVADRAAAKEKPWDGTNYYGGNISIRYEATRDSIVANPEYLLEGSQVELTLTPVSRLFDGSAGHSFTIHKTASEKADNKIKVNNIPLGTYRIKVRALHKGKWSPLSLEETGYRKSPIFGLSPKTAQGEATLTFRSDNEKVAASPMRSNWEPITMDMKGIEGSEKTDEKTDNTGGDNGNDTADGGDYVKDDKPKGGSNPVQDLLDKAKNGFPDKGNGYKGPIGSNPILTPGNPYTPKPGDKAKEAIDKAKGAIDKNKNKNRPVDPKNPIFNPTNPYKPKPGVGKTNLNTGIVPTANDENGGKAESGGLGTRSVDNWEVTADKIGFARGRTLELFATVKNTDEKTANFTISDLSWKITDADGVTLHAVGNLYYVGGKPDEEPERVTTTLHIDPKESVKVRYLFNIPKSNARLITLKLRGYGKNTELIELPELTIPQ